MNSLRAHLESLATAPNEGSTNERKVLEQWTGFASNATGWHGSDLFQDAPPEELWSTVLDVYRDGSGSSSSDSLSAAASIISKLLAKSDVLDPLRTLLSSSRPNDAISGEMAEMIGYEDIELVMGLLEHRAAVTSELSAILAEEGPLHEPATTSSKGHPKGTITYDLSRLSLDDARIRMEDTLRANASRPLFTGVAEKAPEVLPHVYASSAAHGNILSQFGSRYMLPLGTVRKEFEDHEEVIIPPARAAPPRLAERLISVSELDPLAKGSFPGYSSLNRIQSIVYPTAYGSNENMLVCAPTGAGKTDVAMLTVLRVLDQHRNLNASPSAPISSTISRADFKIIYVAPMKALASEIVRKLGKRLQWLSIKVRELTGDMQLTKAEIAETQIIVTTPEKWDVVTRKPTGEDELSSKVKLLIIDEVHLLNDDRGAVIETIVARTLRQVESSQSVIRIVGLSATLPNYVDVAEFLSVSRYTGLFYFDSSFRPVPLEQHFLGIKGKPNSPLSRKNMDRVTYEKVMEIVRRGHQVMVFVHARKETVKTALALKEAALADGALEDLSCEEHPQWSFFRKNIGESRNKEMKQLFDSGFGIHHAGMLRSDRNMMERMFEARAIKVLCCTATLAWGVNLPAHAVVIKGTQVYDSAKGAFVDLSILDVLQVFGRAGRPGMETEGEGYICTTEDKLQHYLDAIMAQHPIESRFLTGIVDSLNAEIALGTVANVSDAVQWLGYTYLFVRMRKNPFQYGLSRDATLDDPHLGNKRTQLTNLAAQKLSEARMIAFDTHNGAFTITDLGRIAAKYYIRHSSIEIFNKAFRPKMTEADVLAMLCMSTEFDQIQVRENEIKELEYLMKEVIPCDVKGGTDTSQGKVNILLQGYICGAYIEDFALVSDTAYAAQNGGRIIRAVMEIAISRKWANVSAVLMSMSKAIEKRMWPFDQPLKQFKLKADVLYGLERWADEWSVADLTGLSADELGKLIHLNEQHGAALLAAAKQFPSAKITYRLRPLGWDVLKISVTVERAFNWNRDIHGLVEPFWLWVEDEQGTTILQLAHLVFRQTTDVVDVDFVISIPNGKPPPSVTIRYVSDRWMGAEDEVAIPLDMLAMPEAPNSHTPRIDIPFLPLTALNSPSLEALFSDRISSLNALQSQVFWSLLKTPMHALVCAPTGSGISTVAQMVVLETVMRSRPRSWVLVVTARKSAAMELITDLRPAARALGIPVASALESDVLSPASDRAIRVVTASNLLAAISGKPPGFSPPGLKLVVCEDLEQLDADYELGVCLLQLAVQSQDTRFVGLSTSLNDASDLAAWLKVDPFALHSFRPRDRDQSLSVSTQTFTIPQSAALFKAMAKPAHSAIMNSGTGSIVFVPSYGQCRQMARDLITQCALGSESGRGYLPQDCTEETLDDYLGHLRDPTLADFISQGVGLYHDGIRREDRTLVLKLYAEGIVKVLVAPREACWTLPVRADVVVVAGTQYVHARADSSERQVRDYSLEEIVRMQGRAVRHNGNGQFHLFCQAESKDTVTRFLEDGLPLESKLLENDVLQQWYRHQRAAGRLSGKQAGVEALSWTFLARRVISNPAYYDASSEPPEERISRLVDRLEDALTT